MRTKKRGNKGIMIAGLLVFAMLSEMIFPFTKMEVNAATVTNCLPIIAYTIRNQCIRTYSSINGTGTGWIYPSDRCTILRLYASGWCLVRYPISEGRTRDTYTQTSNFFVNMDNENNIAYGIYMEKR